jgi:alpha-glucosidase
MAETLELSQGAGRKLPEADFTDEALKNPETGNGKRIDLPGVPPLQVTFISPTAFHIEELKNTDGAARLPDLMVVTPDSKRPAVDLSVSRKDNQVVLSSNALNVALSPVSEGTVQITVTDAGGKSVIENWKLDTKANGATLALRENEHIYGFGDKRLAVDQRGNTLEMLNHDALASTDNTSYKSVPFYRSSRGYGLFFHNWHPVVFDVGKSSAAELKIDSKGGKLDFYVFAADKPQSIISQYTELTGRPSLLPYWTLGFHQSKASYATADEMLAVAKNMREKRLPFDAIYFDDFDNEGTPASFVDKLKNQFHAHLTIGGNPFFIDDSQCRQRLGKQNYLMLDRDGHPVFEPADEVADDNGHGPSVSYVDFFNPKASRAFLDCQLKNSLKKGTDLGMADFGEMDHVADSNQKYWPSLGKEYSVEKMRNLYALAYADAVVGGSQDLTGGRSTGMIRAGTAGTQRYGWATTGDSDPTWTGLQANLKALVNLSNTGFSNIGFDIGGFMYRGADDVYARWFAAGTFLPFMWAHGQQEHEPYAHGAQVEQVARSFLELRYQMLPYLYSLNWQANRTGVPMLRSLSLAHPEDEKAAGMGDQFYLGDGLLVAPVMDATGGRQVYLPQGTWYDFFGDQKEALAAGTVDRLSVPFDRIPVYVRAGSIIPMGPSMQYSNEKPLDPLTIHYYAHTQKELLQESKASDFQLFEDDGTSRKYLSGEFRQTDLHFEQSKQSIRFSSRPAGGNKGYKVPERNQVMAIHGAEASRVRLKGVEIPPLAPGSKASGPHWLKDGKGGTRIFLPAGSSGELELTTGPS